MDFALRPMQGADLTQAIAMTVENFTLDGNVHGQYVTPRVRERLVSRFSSDEYAPRFIVAVKDDGAIIGVVGWGNWTLPYDEELSLHLILKTWGLA